MLTSFGLFAYGVLALFSLSALLSAAGTRQSRRAVLTRGTAMLALVAGTGLLAWRDHAGTLTVGVAWSAAAAALVVVALAAWWERRKH